MYQNLTFWGCHGYRTALKLCFLNLWGQKESVMDLLSVFLALMFCFSSQSRHTLLAFFTQIIRGGERFYGQALIAQNFSNKQWNSGSLFQDLDSWVLVSWAAWGGWWQGQYALLYVRDRHRGLPVCISVILELLLFHNQILCAADWCHGSGNQCWMLLMVPGTAVLSKLQISALGPVL